MTSMTAIHAGASSEVTTPRARKRFEFAVDRTMETCEAFTDRLPFVVMRRSRLNQQVRAAFNYGREVEFEAAIAAQRDRAGVPAPRKVRHLQAVSS